MSGPTVQGGVAANNEDPKRLIEQAFEMGAEFPGPAEDLLLSWMLSLPVDADAPAIAARLAERYGAALSALGDLGAKHPIARLHNLLRQTAEAGATGGRGRRGGRRQNGPAAGR
jgi:hypothetical protein